MPGDLSLPVMLATGILPGFGARRAPGPAWHPSSLFEGVIGGFWFDFTDTDKLRQTSVGVPPVATASDPVGLAFDQSRWAGKTYSQMLAEQPELAPNGGGPFVSADDWSRQDFNTTLSIDAGRLRLDFAGGSTYAYTSFPTTAGEFYAVEVEFELGSNATMCAGVIRDQTNGGTSIVGEAATQSVSSPIKFFFTALSTISVLRGAFEKTNPATAYVNSVSVKHVPGNHASQPSSSLRPTYQVTHVRGDGSDDRLITSQNPTLAGTLIYAGTFEAASDVAIGVTGAGGVDRCMLRTSADGYLQAAIGDQASGIIGAMDIRGVDGVYAVRWGGNGEAVKLTRGLTVEYAGVQEGSVTTAFPFLLGAVNAGGSATGFLDGKMRHCLFVPRFITDDELSQAVKYFS